MVFEGEFAGQFDQGALDDGFGGGGTLVKLPTALVPAYVVRFEAVPQLPYCEEFTIG